MRIKYEEWSPGPAARRDISHANEIAASYRRQGYNLTLRQLYYRFVAADLIPNNQRSYKRLGDVVNRGRMAGLIDWNYIEDRTRNLNTPASWKSPTEILRIARDQYAEDLWADQPIRVEVWVEKDALVDVVGRAARKWHAPHFSCRGYTSQSEMWSAGQRILHRLENGQRTLVLHLGDHDPSGIDMSRDIRDRLNTFVMTDPGQWEAARDAGERDPYHRWAKAPDPLDFPHSFEIRRIALNMDQVEQYDPPPNPAKLSDSRAENYIATYGDDSWELDALEPSVLNALIEDEIGAAITDPAAWAAAEDHQDDNRNRIAAAIANMADDLNEEE